jgi:predicted protein tyrosine phosphatase
LFQDSAPLRGLAELVMPQLGDRVFEFFDQQRPVLRLALATLARASAASRASRVAMIIACALARSVGSESAASAMRHKNHKIIRL